MTNLSCLFIDVASSNCTPLNCLTNMYPLPLSLINSIEFSAPYYSPFIYFLVYTCALLNLFLRIGIPKMSNHVFMQFDHNSISQINVFTFLDLNESLMC